MKLSDKEIVIDYMCEVSSKSLFEDTKIETEDREEIQAFIDKIRKHLLRIHRECEPNRECKTRYCYRCEGKGTIGGQRCYGQYEMPF